MFQKGQISSGLYDFKKMKKQLASILEDPRCTPEQRLECVHKIEQYRKEQTQKQYNKPSVKNKTFRSKPKVAQNTSALSNLVQKVELTQ